MKKLRYQNTISQSNITKIYDKTYNEMKSKIDNTYVLTKSISLVVH